jgi:hypothetical protein
MPNRVIRHIQLLQIADDLAVLSQGLNNIVDVFIFQVDGFVVNIQAVGSFSDTDSR